MTGKGRQPALVPLQIFLRRLILICIAPLLLLAAWLAFDSLRELQQQYHQQAERISANLTNAIDQHLLSRIKTLHMLALSPLVDDPAHWPQLYQEAKAFSESFGSHVILADIDEPMRMLFNTRLPLGSPLPPLPRPQGRAAAPLAVATGKPAVGDSFFGPIAQEPLVAIAVPVQRQGKVVHLLLTIFEIRQFQALLDTFDLPEGWAMTLRDSRGEILAHRGPRALIDEGRDKQLRQAVNRPTVAPWSIAVLIPTEVQGRDLYKAGLALLLGLAGATVVSLLAGLAASRRLSRAVASLTRLGGQDQEVVDIAEISVAKEVLDQALTGLQESEERFRRLFRDAHLPMLYLDGHGVVAAINRRFTQMFGYALQDIPHLAQWWIKAFPDPLHRAEVQKSWSVAVDRAGDNQDIEIGEQRLTCGDGAQRIVQISGIAVHEGILVTLVDVTERRQSEEQLRLWAESFERAQLGLAIADAANNTFVAVNPAFAAERGYRREELVGKPLLTMYPQELQAEIQQMIGEVDRVSHGVFESEHLTRDGRRFPVLLDITVLRDASGKPVNRVVYALDLTTRKQAEQALRTLQAEALEQQKQARLAALNQMQDANAARARAEAALAALKESEERYRLVSENGSDVIWLFDLEADRFTYVSPSVERLRGFSVAEVLNQDMQQALGAESYRMVAANLPGRLAAFAGGDPAARIQTHEVAQVRKDGTLVPTETVTTLIADCQGRVTHIQGVTRDITERKQAEAEILRLNADLERRVIERTAELVGANRELDSFAYAVSHDLRTPLRAMNGFSRALIEEYGDRLQGEGRVYLEQIITGSRRMGELIDGLLVLSRSTRNPLKREPVDLSAMARQLLAELAAIEPQRQVQSTIEPGMVVQGDRIMLEVVLRNLLGNSWKYTAHRAPAIIGVSVRGQEGGMVTICIADNGAGFDMAHAGKLFQPFQRLHRQDEFPGLGIGLATVQRIIHRHGGTLEATGEKDKGATFCFSLPRQSEGDHD